MSSSSPSSRFRFVAVVVVVLVARMGTFENDGGAGVVVEAFQGRSSVLPLPDNRSRWGTSTKAATTIITANGRVRSRSQPPLFAKKKPERYRDNAEGVVYVNDKVRK